MNGVKPSGRWRESIHLSICVLSLVWNLLLLALSLLLILPPPSYFTTWKLPSPCFPSPRVSVGCINCIFQKFRTGRGESHSHHQPPPKLLSLPCSAYESQRSQYLQSSKSWTVECCCCCGGECLASSRQPAGSEGGVGLWKRTEKCLYN